MKGGWIKLHRKLADKAYYSKDSEKVHLWVHLLLKATHLGREEMFGGKPITCQPGQFTTGRKQLAQETGISESKIERILNFFAEIEQQIEQRKTTTNRLISIINWDEYQQTEQQIEQQSNNDRTTTEQRVNTLQEGKEGKEGNNDNNELFLFPPSEKMNYESFIKLFNSLTHRGFKGDKKTENQLKARIKEGYTQEQFKKAIENAANDEWLKEHPTHLTPEFITRADKLEKYLNAKTPVGAGAVNSYKSGKNGNNFNGKTRPSDWAN